MTTPRQALVCVDYEGPWGMPFAARYDLEASTHTILETLARHDVHAIFFVVGALAVEHPELLRTIWTEGHELAVHGWRHEHLERLSTRELACFGEGLHESEVAIEAVTGKRPVGFRAPYLLGPAFFDAAVYDLLAGHGYRWTSNREIRHVVELLRPDRIRSERPWHFVRSRPRLLEGIAAQATLLALNPSVFRRGRVSPSISAASRWLWAGCPPFYRGQLLEIPLYSPMDCDLVGLPAPSCPTPQALLDFARFALQSCLSRSSPLTMLTFHDWIISGANRIQLLDAVLSFMVEAGVRSTSVEEAWLPS
jgi:Polysaccharide deacetylase